MTTKLKGDIFDKIELDIFDKIDAPLLKEYVAPPKVSVSLSDDIRALVKAEIANAIKSAVADAVKNIKPHTIETKTVERVVEKTIPTPEKIIEKQVLDDAVLQKTIDEKVKKAVDESSLFVPAPPIIPNWSDKPDGYVLSKAGSQLIWVKASEGGSTSTDEYVVNNGTTQRTFDADDTSIDEIADVLGSLISSLQGAGIIQ